MTTTTSTTNNVAKSEEKKMQTLVKQYEVLVNDIPYLIRGQYTPTNIPHVNSVYGDCKKLVNNIESFARDNGLSVADVKAIQFKNGKRLAIVAKKDKRQLKAHTKGKRRNKA